MTASWNSSDEVGWPAGDEGSHDPEPFRSDWPSFEDSLRAHGFEVAAPAVDTATADAPAPEGLTSDGMSRAAVEQASRFAAHPATAEPAQSETIAEPASAEAETSTQQTDSGMAETASDFWSFEPDNTSWIDADAVAQPGSTEVADEADAPVATDETANAGIAFAQDAPASAEPDERAAAWDGFDDTDAPVLPDVGEPMDRAPLSVFGEEAAPTSAGAVFQATDFDDFQLEDGSVDAGSGNGHDETSDRWWTEPEDALGAVDGAGEPTSEVEDSLAVEPDSYAEPAMDAGSDGAPADEMSAGEAPAEPYHDPTHGAHVPQSLPDDRLPTPPPDLVARFARRGAAAADVAELTEAEAPTRAPEEPAAFVPWTYDEAETAPVTSAETQPADAEASTEAAAPDDAFWGAAETEAAQHDSWTTSAESSDMQADASAEDPGAGDAAGWSDWSTIAGPEAIADSTDAVAPDQSSAPDAEQPEDMMAAAAGAPEDGDQPNAVSVDWYEAAAIEAVGTSSNDELSNTEFVGYTAPVVGAAAAAGIVDGADHADATAHAAPDADESHDQAAGHEPDASGSSTEDDDHRNGLGWAVLGAAAVSDGRESSQDESHAWNADDEWPEATASDATASDAGHDHAAAFGEPDTHEAADGDHQSTEPATAAAEPTIGEAASAEPAAAEPEAVGAASTATGAQPESTTADAHAWPMPEAVDWEAADQDAWSTPGSAKPWTDSESAAAAAAVAATGAAVAAPSAGPSISASTAEATDPSKSQPDARAAAYTTTNHLSGSGLFSRYDTSPALAVGAASAAAAGSTATTARGESDLWHLVSEPSATAPTSSEKRSFDPVTVFLTVLVAIIIVALLLGLLYTVAPMLTGGVH
jgi:hypothetical protein